MTKVHLAILPTGYVTSIKRQKYLVFIVLSNGEEVEVSLYRKDEIFKQLQF